MARSGAILLAVLILVAMPLVNPARPRSIYLGQISPNVRHNATHIFSVPFSLVAFVTAVALVRSLSLRAAGAFAVAVALSTMAKPNCALALVPVVGPALLVRLIRERRSIRSALGVLALAVGPVIAVLLYQYLMVFQGDSVRDTDMVWPRW